MIKTNVTFHFSISEEEVTVAEKKLDQNGKYDGWHTADGIDNKGSICVNGRVQVYLRSR